MAGPVPDEGWFSDPVTIQIRPCVYGARDNRGDVTKTYPAWRWFDQPGCALEPRYSNDVNASGHGGQVIVGQWLYGPWDIELNSDDQVFYDGQLYTIEGIVGRPRNPWTGDKPGSQTALVGVSNGR